MISSPEVEHQGRPVDGVAALELRDIKKDFSDTHVLRSINLRVDRGNL